MRPLETRYALALLELTQDEAGLEAGASLVMGDPALWAALQNPCVSQKEKERVLCRLLSGRVEEELLGFFRLLSRRERLPLLPAVQREYHRLKLEKEGGAVAEFRCARKPAPEDLERLGDALKKRRGYAKIEFHVVLDPSLLGGFVIRLGGVTYDKSVKAMLQGLGRSLKGRE